MRLARLHHGDRIVLARLEGETALPLAIERPDVAADVLRDALFAGHALTEIGEPPIDLADCTLLAPVAWPQKVLAIGLNYSDHASEAGLPIPSAPMTFIKTNNSIVGSGAAVTWRTSQSTKVDYEAELAVVIGRRAVDVAVDDALDYVFGYTCCNDVSARDAQLAEPQWNRAKSFDTFCPLGPWVVTRDKIPDPQALGIRCRVNGDLRQDSSTSKMIFGVAELVSYLSRYLTLMPGDILATGTPHGVGFVRQPPVFLADGDQVDVEIDGIGTLSNRMEVKS